MMGILDETRFVERLQFFNGQQLFASDLQGLESFNREMRWLHNRSLHQAGVGNGFAVTGPKGDREVTIRPGYALDALGREIVLTQMQVEPIPPVASEDDGQSVWYDLAVSYPDDAQLDVSETRQGICLPRGVVRLREAPIFCWVRLKRDELRNNTLRPVNPLLEQDIKNGMRIVLARIEVLNCQLNQDVIIAQRRSARPIRQPYVMCGEAAPVDWSVWTIDQGKMPIGLFANVDTRSAGFLTTPCYTARIDGPRPGVVTFASSDGEAVVVDVFDGPVYVQDSTPGGFTVYVILILLYDSSGAVFELARDWAKEHWGIVWLGVEG